MAVTSNDIANQAIVLCGDNQPPVTGLAPTFDSSTAGKALAVLYGPCVGAVLRSFGWDAVRRIFALTLSGNPGGTIATLNFPFEYLYPPFALEIWQLLDPTNTDPNDPLPTTKMVGNTLVNGVQTKVIWSNIASAFAVLNNNPTEAVWDPILREIIVRRLAGELAIALAGRPETEASLMASSNEAAKINVTRDG